MSYQRERESFLIAMGKHGMSADVARLILRHAQTYHCLSERECNGDDWQDGDKAMGIRCGTLVRCPMGLGKHAVRIGDCDNCGAQQLQEGGHTYVTKSSVRMAQLERRLTELVSRAGEFSAGFDGDPRGWEVRIYVGGAHGLEVGIPRKG